MGFKIVLILLVYNYFCCNIYVYRVGDKWFLFCYREEKLSKLCSVMGVDVFYDFDLIYEFIIDNVKKILVIYMCFRYLNILLFSLKNIVYIF